jgi:hypothetical protein
MGYYARLSEPHGLTDDDADRLAQDGLVELPASNGPISGFVTRNGRSMPFTLDTTNMVHEPLQVQPEQIAIFAVLVASFIAPILHLLG